MMSIKKKIENLTFKREFLLENLWILDKESGICIYEQDFRIDSNSEYSVDLVSAFINAMAMFADETFSEGIERIEFKQKKIYFRFSGKLLFVFIFRKNVRISESEINHLINLTVNCFSKMFSSTLNEEYFYNRFELYETFDEKACEIAKKKSPFGNILELLRIF